MGALKILRSARSDLPGQDSQGRESSELPFEQPTKYSLAVNLKTAKALALTIPQSLVMRADEVIQ